MKFFTRHREERSQVEALKITAQAAEDERKRAASRLMKILDCAADATNDALGELVGGRENGVAHKR